MQRGRLDDLQAFVAVARERSFTKAAAKLGVSQSALSHTIRELEERLGIRLLSRTTRSVSTAEAGHRLLHNIGPRFDVIEAVVAAPSYFKKRSAPKSPKDLIGHNCINVRLPVHGGIYAWEFDNGGRELKVLVEGQFTFSATAQMLNAALTGAWLAYVPESMV